MKPPPYPHDPVRYPEREPYAGCEQLDGRLRVPHTSGFYDLVFDTSGHDRGDEDRS